MTLAHDLDEITEWIRKYTVLPGRFTAEVMALWAAHTHGSTAFYTSPRIAFVSPQAGSGKTRALELLALVCHNPKTTVSSTPAALFRRVGAAHHEKQLPPTILFDEIDTVFGSSRPSEQTEQLRALINAGYKRGATVDRCEGDASRMQVVEWPVFAPVALAGLTGHLPDTITSRAILIPMKKRARTEHVEPFTEQDASNQIADAVSRMRKHIQAGYKILESARPLIPEGVVDRPSEVWSPLLAVADLAGGRWPEIAREACEEFVFANTPQKPSLGIELLSDIRDVMGHGNTLNPAVDRMKTTDLLNRLNQLEESPWSDLGYGKRLNARKLAIMLADYEIAPVTFKDKNGISAKGYVSYETRTQPGLADAWDRYLTPPSRIVSNHGNPVTMQVKYPKPVTFRKPVTVTEESSKFPESPASDQVTVTTDQKVTKNIPLSREVTELPQLPAKRDGAKGSQSETTNQIREALIDSLGDDIALGRNVLIGCVPQKMAPRQEVEQVLDDLATEGRIVLDRDGKYRLHQAA